jgi:hypothetical protein
MFDLHSLSTALTLLKIAVGLCMLAQLPIFLFKLLMGRHSFIKDKGRSRSLARALMPEPDWMAAAFEEVKQSRGSQRGGAGAAPDIPDGHVADPHAPIVVTIARDRSGKFQIPEHAFERIDAGR